MDILEKIKKLYQRKTIDISSVIFQMHSHLNSGFLVILFISSVCRELFSVPMISCSHRNKGLLEQVSVDQYCLNTGGYIVIRTPDFNQRPLTNAEQRYLKKFNHNGNAGPGLETLGTENTEVKNISYYKWIPFSFLFLVTFYLCN